MFVSKMATTKLKTGRVPSKKTLQKKNMPHAVDSF
jgi:hypothetical protein